MDSHTYKYLNKWLFQCNLNKIANKIENVTSINIELNIIKDIIDMFEKRLKQKKAQLNDVNIQLNNTDQEKWATRDVFCCQVWNFSLDHDFLKVFEHYPYIINPIKIHNCSYNATNKNIKNKCNDEAGTEINEDIEKLQKEIISLKEEIHNIVSKNRELEIQNLSLRLEHLKLFSEEIIELLNLIHSAENVDYVKKYNKNVTKYKNKKFSTAKNKNNTLTFTKAKVLLHQHNSHSHVLKDKNNMTSKMIIKNKTECLSNDNQKQQRSKFAVKTQSNISLKFEQKRYLQETQKEC